MQSSLSPLLIASAGFFACVAPLRAEVKWDAKRIDLKPRPVDAVAEAKFGFVNEGKEAVTIESVKSCCGCTTSALQKTTYAAGERGELVAQFSIGNRHGPQSVRISVAIKGEPEPAALTLNVAIPEAARMTPALLLWDAGAKTGSKTIEVEAFPGEPIQVAKVTASTADFEAKVETIEENAKYRVVVTPASTENSAFAMLDIETRIAGGEKTLRAFAQVQRVERPAMPSEPIPTVTPGAAQLDPVLVAWDQGSKPESRTIMVRAPAGRTIKVLKAIASTANIEACVELVAESHEYRIIVTPRSTEKPDMGFVRIEMESDSGAQVQTVRLQIAPPAK